MEKSLIVRDVMFEDFKTIQEIYAAHVLHGVATFEEHPPSEEEMYSRYQRIAADGLPYLVAEQNEVILGYCYAAPYRPRSAYRFTVENSIYIREGMMGRGVGTQLLSSLITHCEKGSWQQMLATISLHDNSASLKLHRRMGFEHVGMLKAVGFKHGQWLDTVFMQRALK